ncbi:glycosyltransferase family 2 protein [archaeon]|jgi:glycosyltransferase involved in cell wall biosynthesis|nr:glycosyltransferase family 2 protein [archaeon]MBT4396839.1 glycosyltransferase family 2 protein [archaeon]MBT4441483.1 glycosyltransferase family 2 protein [archaeon]
MLTIITIPAYNEEETLPSVIKEIDMVMKKTKYVYKIMVLDDGSVDNTVKVAKKAGAIVYSNLRNRGLAETFKHEMRRCLDLNADIIVHTDADGQYPAEYIPVMLKEIAKGNDLILGSRFAGEIEDMPCLKKWGNIAFAKVFAQLTKTKITDSTTGFRAFTKDVAKEIELNTDFTYTHEQLLKASRLKFKIKEIPIYARKTRESKLMKGPIDYAIKAWINLFRIQRDYNPLGFFGKIGIIFLTVGILLGLWIVQTFLLTGQTGGIPRTILSVLLILTGVQIIFFGFLAEMQKK